MPGLANEQLDEHADLSITTDYRQVLSELFSRECEARMSPGSFRDSSRELLWGSSESEAPVRAQSATLTDSILLGMAFPIHDTMPRWTPTWPVLLFNKKILEMPVVTNPVALPIQRPPSSHADRGGARFG